MNMIEVSSALAPERGLQPFLLFGDGFSHVAGVLEDMAQGTVDNGTAEKQRRNETEYGSTTRWLSCEPSGQSLEE